MGRRSRGQSQRQDCCPRPRPRRATACSLAAALLKPNSRPTHFTHWKRIIQGCLGCSQVCQQHCRRVLEYSVTPKRSPAPTPGHSHYSRGPIPWHPLGGSLSPRTRLLWTSQTRRIFELLPPCVLCSGGGHAGRAPATHKAPQRCPCGRQREDGGHSGWGHSRCSRLLQGLNRGQLRRRHSN